MRYDRGYGQRVIDTLLDGDPEGLFDREAHREALMLAFAPLQWPNGEEAAGAGVRGLKIDNQLRRELLAGYERRWEPDRISSLYGLLLDARETGEDDGGAEAGNANAGRSEAGGKGREELRAEWTRIASEAVQLSGEEFSILRRISGEAGLGVQRLADFSGELRLDTDRDGFVDRRIVYEAGELVEMSRDLDQNTRPEIIVTFRNGSPQRVAFHENEMAGRAHGEIVGRYGRYPNLVSASYVSADEKIDVELVPYEVDFDLLVEENWSPLSPPTIPRGISFPSFDVILPYAAKVERSEGASTQTYSAEEGRSTLYPTAARDKSILGRYSGAELQRRMRDVDGDGFEEITEVYEQGELRVISFDGNGNNKAEYVERYEDGAVLRLWDIDEDGTFDYEMRIENRRADDEVEQQ
jgi:hypothetical protein